jgi:crotonobetainyl-CoA:carnitine CoA-transferase CaiB-like acyl-CoA transferase
VQFIIRILIALTQKVDWTKRNLSSGSGTDWPPPCHLLRSCQTQQQPPPAAESLEGTGEGKNGATGVNDRTLADRARSASNLDLPLSGIRVLELGRMLAAPLVGQLLGDLGADVVKIERLGEGDDFRRYGLVFVKDSDGNPTAESAAYTSMNRNKRSVAVDLAQPEGSELVRDLAHNCDIFIENFKVGSLARFGLDYAAQQAVNPGLIYLSVTGFGQAGPYAHRPATDSVFQAMSGLMDVTGEPDGEPVKVGTYAVDYTAGLYGALAVLAALRHRDMTGTGQHIDLSLLDCGIALVAPRSCDYLVGGSVPGRIGNRTPGTAPGQLFRCADGHLMVQAGGDRQFATLCRIINRTDLLDDPRFATIQLRLVNIDALAETLEETFLTRTSRDWFDLLSEAGVLTAPTYDVAQCFADPQVQERGVRITVPHPIGGSVDLVASPMRFSATPIETYRAPPPMGEGADDVLSSWLGYDRKRIDQLRAARAI